MTITISLGFFVVLCISLAFFILAAWFGHVSGAFDTWDNRELVAHIACVYAVLWALPSFIAFGVWAIWFR